MKSVKNIILDALKFFRIQLLKDNYSTTITNGNKYALSQAGAKAMYDELNSRKYYLMDRAGTVIPDNSDLNSYTTPGRYYCLNSASAATLSNCPYQAGFNLYVETVGYNWIHQTLRVCSNSVVYERIYDDSSWSDWRLLNLVHGGNVYGSINHTIVDVDATKANNNISSTYYPTTSCIMDGSQRILSRQEGLVFSDGRIGSHWYCRNYNTSGDVVAQKGIQMIMDKSGNITYSVADNTRFLSALGAGSLIIAQRFSVTPPSKTSGGKTSTVTIPSGYKLLIGGPLSDYISGDGRVYVTDKSLSQSGTTVTINYYLYNPSNSTGNLAYSGWILMIRNNVA